MDDQIASLRSWHITPEMRIVHRSRLEDAQSWLIEMVTALMAEEDICGIIRRIQRLDVLDEAERCLLGLRRALWR